MTDKEKLLKLYNDLKNIQLPELSEELQIIPDTLKVGIEFILDWIKKKANKHFNNK